MDVECVALSILLNRKSVMEPAVMKSGREHQIYSQRDCEDLFPVTDNIGNIGLTGETCCLFVPTNMEEDVAPLFFVC